MKGSTVNEIEDNLVQQEAEWRGGVKRLATDDDRERVLALGKELDIPIPGTTTVSLDRDELAALRSGFVRNYPRDEAIYLKLTRAEKRLIERLGH